MPMVLARSPTGSSSKKCAMPVMWPALVGSLGRVGLR
jgi:hypothetical protein